MEGFYKVAYQTARERMDVPKDQFRSLLLRLIGDKDHENVLDIVSKVEKHQGPSDPTTTTSASTTFERGRHGCCRLQLTTKIFQ